MLGFSLVSCALTQSFARYGSSGDSQSSSCGSLGWSQVVAIKVSGCGISESIPTVVGSTSPHWANGKMQIGEPGECYEYRGAGVVRLDKPVTDPTKLPATFDFSSPVPFVFSTEEGDLACLYGRADVDAKDPGLVTLYPVPGAGPTMVYAKFYAEFNPVLAECTGRFAKLVGGSFFLTAVSDPFDITNPVHVPYKWYGSGTLEFNNQKCDSDDDSVPYEGSGTGVYYESTGDYTGSGTGTPLGYHTFVGNVITIPTADPLVFKFHSTTPQETTSAQGKIFFSSSGTIVLTPVDQTHFVAKWTGDFVVLGGTGVYANARPAEHPLKVVAINDKFSFQDPFWSFSWTLTGRIVLKPSS